MISDDFDLNPRIRPVVDLSDVHKSAKEIGGLFVDPIIRNDTSMNLANHNARFMDPSEYSPVDDRPNVQPSNTFIQNNYSPKALSHTEIYRQTRSQLAMAERNNRA